MNRTNRKSKLYAGILAVFLFSGFLLVVADSAEATPMEPVGMLAKLPEMRHAPGTAYLDGMIYVFGGSLSVPGDLGDGLNTTLIYNVATGETTNGTNMPIGVATPVCVLGNDSLIYVIGGWNSSMVTYPLVTQIYNPATDSWSSGAATPSEIGRSASTLGTDGKIYIFGNGWNSGQTLIYDPALDSWSTGTDLNDFTYDASAITISDTEIWVIGGNLDDELRIYNPQTDSWSFGTPLPAIRGMGGAAVGQNGYVYYFGGTTGGNLLSLASDIVYRYDFTTSSWTSVANLMEAVTYFGTVMDDNGRIILVGGYSSGISDVTDTVQSIAPMDSSDAKSIVITSPNDGAVLSDEVSISIKVNSMFLFWGYSTVNLLIDDSLVTFWNDFWEGVYIWDTSSLADMSSHTITVVAIDYDGTVSTQSITVTVSAQSIDEKIAALEDQIGDLEDQLADLQAQITTLQDQLAAVNSSLSGEIDDLQSQLNALNSDLSDLQDLIDSLETSLSGQLDDLDSALAGLDDKQDETIGDVGDVNNTASSANTMAMMSMLLALVAVILIALNIALSMRKKKDEAPPPPSQ